jgi:RNA polymerase sigma-70 factor (ECF subfamily)
MNSSGSSNSPERPEARRQDASTAGFEINGLIEGKERDWSAFVEWSAPLIHRAVSRVAGGDRPPFSNAEEREDVLQEVYARLYKNERRLLRQFDPERAAFSTWLALVARSAALNTLRKTPPPALPLFDVPEEKLSFESDQSASIVLPEGVLTDKESVILRMEYDEGHSLEEIARNLKLSRRTIYNCKSTALKKLRLHLS